mgnify:CR=1 FL=1
MLTKTLVLGFERWIHGCKGMKFNNSDHSFPGLVCPADEGFVEESNHGVWVRIGDVDRKMGNSGEVQVGFETSFFLAFCFVGTLFDLSIGERLPYDPFNFTPLPSLILTAHLRTVCLLIMSTSAIDVTDYSRNWSSPRMGRLDLVGSIGKIWGQ